MRYVEKLGATQRLWQALAVDEIIALYRGAHASGTPSAEDGCGLR